MISAAGIKDQELTIIVSMMLIELALLRLRFKRLALLDTQGLELLVALHSRVGWARRAGRLGQEGEFKGAEYSEFRNPSVSGSPLEAEDAEKAGLGIEHPILQVAAYDGVESVNEIIELP